MSFRKQSKKSVQSWGAKVRTLDSIDAIQSSEGGSSSSSSSSVPSSSLLKIQHIPNLPQQKEAMAILQRIRSEFLTIVERRGYTVTTLTEMCCCGDGLDHINSSNSKRKRKTRVMPHNVLGYNLTTGSSRSRSVHRIHLRLRHPKTHILYPYEDIAGTMCHELAHCERGPHDATFYKLMDDIMEQHAIYMAKGIVADKDGFPMGSTQAYTLGGSSSSSSSSKQVGSTVNSEDGRRLRGNAAHARIERQRRLGGTYVLGGKLQQRGNRGGSSANSTSSSRSLAHLPPREAARIAAERRVEQRRRNDSLYCLPCNEIIEILDESSSEDASDDDEIEEHRNESNNTNSKRGIRAKRQKPKSADGKEDGFPNKVIDLTIDDSTTCDHDNLSTTNAQSSEPKWNCITCTFANESTILACSMCGMTRVTKDENEKAVQSVLRLDFIESVKENEVKKSERDFDGFNIYGNASTKSSTLRHLT